MAQNYTRLSLNALFSLLLTLSTPPLYAMDVPIERFSIAPYDQTVAHYLSPNTPDFSKPLLAPEYQQLQFNQFYNHYYASDAKGLSPWSEELVNSVLSIIKNEESILLEQFNNQDKTLEARHYGENFQEHDAVWWNHIKLNMNVDALDATHFNAENRAIAVANTHARALPDLAPDFFHASLPGQGFPFDNLQDSAIWAGTPLYVVSLSKDRAWALVITPDAYFAWVKAADIAYASSGFIKQWQAQAQKGLAAITQTETSVVDTQQRYQFTSYIGAVFPLAQRAGDQLSILIPVKDAHQQAHVKLAQVDINAAVPMPLVASKQHIAGLLSQLQHRPYGWGGAYFLNDCSQELKSLFTPFGIWLPRNSRAQSQLSSAVDLSQLDMDERIKTLQTQGHPLMTIIYIGGHVMLYIGEQADKTESPRPITYQNLWGLRNLNATLRYVIGESVFIPLLKSFPERLDIQSQASHRDFKLVYLDTLNAHQESTGRMISQFKTMQHVN
jgi:cell wall-associated NlpC family hydrolase